MVAGKEKSINAACPALCFCPDGRRILAAQMALAGLDPAAAERQFEAHILDNREPR